MSGLDLAAMLEEHARRWRDRPAVLEMESGRRHDYAGFAERVRRLAGWMESAGLKQGDRVVWLGQNSHCVLELLVAAGRLGAVLAILNWRQSEDELRFVLHDLDPQIVVWQPDSLPDTLRAEWQDKSCTWLRQDSLDPGCDYETAIAGAPEAVAVTMPSDAPQLLLYTAAFSGRPAAAILTRQALVLQALQYAALRGWNHSTTYLSATPLFHVATLLDCLATFTVGGHNLFVRQADPADMCAIIAAEKVSDTFILPPTMEKILELGDARPDLSSLRSQPYKPEWNALVTLDDSLWGKRPYGYGQTETMGYATFSALGDPGKGGMGRPSALVRMAMLDEDGRELPEGEVGEIGVRGWTVSPGYWRRPEINAERYTADGWRRTNDLGRRESDGTVSFIGPKGRLIKSAAENIYPAEVERCIAQIDGVAEVAVIGTPDPVWMQSVRAIVVAKPGAQIDEAAVIDHCRTAIASYKKPRSVIFADSLPRAGVAIDYAALDRLYEGGGYPAG